MNKNDIFPSQYLKATDLPDEGAETFTIEKVEIEEIGKNKDRKPVIHFEETHKRLVCNKTNFNTIEKLTGSDETDDWTGVKISLYRAEVEYQGDMVEAIRVKIKTAKGSKSVDMSQPKSTDEPF